MLVKYKVNLSQMHGATMKVCTDNFNLALRFLT